MDFGALGYAESARSSWDVFSRLQAAGDLPASWRFQVSLPTPLAPIHAFVVPGQELALEPAYEAAMRNEVEEIASFVPHEKLAFQWDTAVEFGILEEVFPPYFPGDVREGILDRLTRYASWVPDDVELGYHLCYGDMDHEHFKQPQDAGKLADIANGVSAALDRSLSWIHLPVPRDRDDVAFFAPLADLALHDETELYLGLVHITDGVDGTAGASRPPRGSRRRSASRPSAGWGDGPRTRSCRCSTSTPRWPRPAPERGGPCRLRAVCPRFRHIDPVIR